MLRRQHPILTDKLKDPWASVMLKAAAEPPKPYGTGSANGLFVMRSFRSLFVNLRQGYYNYMMQNNGVIICVNLRSLRENYMPAELAEIRRQDIYKIQVDNLDFFKVRGNYQKSNFYISAPRFEHFVG